MGRRALITGIAGQDGWYLTRMLLDRGYTVVGIDIDVDRIIRMSARFAGSIESCALSVLEKDIADERALKDIVDRFYPSEVYNLAAQSNVGLSFEDPSATVRGIVEGTRLLLEILYDHARTARFYQASSAEMFGNSPSPQSESTDFAPISPYASAKLEAHRIAGHFRSSREMFVCSGVLFNHESPIRRPEFVTRKITQGVAAIAARKIDGIRLGNLHSKRDWGHAYDSVRAMWLMLQQSHPKDYVIATGESRSVAEFARSAFECIGLDWRQYVAEDPLLLRPSDPSDLRGDAEKARTELGWQPTVGFNELVREMVKQDLIAEGLEPVTHFRNSRRECEYGDIQ